MTPQLALARLLVTAACLTPGITVSAFMYRQGVIHRLGCRHPWHDTAVGVPFMVVGLIYASHITTKLRRRLR